MAEGRGGRARVLEVLGRPRRDRGAARGAGRRGRGRRLAGAGGARAGRPASRSAAGGAGAKRPARRLTFTIDPPDARDFDDAITVEREPDGLRVFVHIADVSAFVAAGGALDREAWQRGCSVYLPGRVEPMLPHPLSSGVCSLQPGVDRYAVTIEVAPDGGITAYRSAIRSDHRLSYPQVERMLAGDEPAAPRLRRRSRTHGRWAGAARRPGSPAAPPASRAATRVHVRRRRRGGGRGGGRARGAHAGRGADAAGQRGGGGAARRRTRAVFRVHEHPEPDAVRLLAERLEALAVPTPPQPDLHGGREAAAYAASVSEWVTRYPTRAGAGRRSPLLVLRCAASGRAETAEISATPAWPAPPTATSPRRSAATPTCSCHRALLAHLGAGEGALDADALAQAAARSSERRARRRAASSAAATMSAWPSCSSTSCSSGAGRQPFAGEVVGMIEGALFVRFGGIFEGLLPVRALGPRAG